MNNNDEEKHEHPVEPQHEGGAQESQAKHWRFTINFAGADGHREREEYSVGLRDRILQQIESGSLAYAIIGREMGASGTNHLQGHLSWKIKQRFNRTKTVVGGRAWIAVSTYPKASAQYCKKENDYEEFGTPPITCQGKRNDIARFVDDARDGLSWNQLAETHPAVMIKYWNNAQKWHDGRRTWRSLDAWEGPYVTYLWGPSGTGKTHLAMVESDAILVPDNVWISCDNTLQWFNGYAGHLSAIFDDMDQFPTQRLDMMKKILDKYPIQVPTKGGFVKWLPIKIFITSNIDFEDFIGPLQKQHADAIRRRINCVKNMTTVYRQ